MKSKLSSITLVLLLLSFGFWHNDASAQCQYLQPDGVTIDPNINLLEVVGGNLFGGPIEGSDIPRTTHDLFVYLTDDDPNNLHVALIDQNTLDTQFSSFPVNPFAFGFSDRIVNTVAGLGFCFIDGADPNGGTPTFGYAMVNDPLNFTTSPIVNSNDYDSCALIKNDGFDNFFTDKIAAMAHNRNLNELNIWESEDGGMTWTDGPTVPNVSGPLDGSLVPNIVRRPESDSYFVVYGRENGGGTFNTFLENTGTGVSQNLGTDNINPSILKESCAAKKGDIAIFNYYKSNEGKVPLVKTDDTFGTPGGAPAKVDDVIDAPDFNAPGEQGFFGSGCIHIPDGPGNPQGFDFGVTAPGGKTYNIKFANVNGTLMGEIVQTNPGRDPTRNTQSGPVALSKINTALDLAPFGGSNSIGESVAYSQSFEYAQCVFREQTGIPTLSEWGLIALAGILMLSGALYLRRKIST